MSKKLTEAPEQQALEFPKDFQWGTATAAYQIEGAPEADGKGASIWDEFTHMKGNVFHGETGDVACDHYNRYEEDIKLMAKLGMKNYRLSISWPRILPNGTGEVNQKGIDFYHRVIDCLIDNGITPLVTLYHWDLPLALEKEFGGFLSRDIIPAFENYAKVCFENFGNKVKSWITFNEPWCVTVLGFCNGMHAPGRMNAPGREPYLAAHHLLLSHSKAVALYRKEYQKRQGGVIGITLNTEWWSPASNDPRDVAAAERAIAFNLGWFADPVFLTGDYPKEMRDALGDRLPSFTAQEQEALKGSSDFFGLNHYSSHIVGRMNACVALSTLPKELGLLFKSSPSTKKALKMVFGFTGSTYFKDIGILTYPDPRDTEYTEMGWAVAPWGFGDLLLHITQRYAPKGGIIVTENGCAMPDKTKQDAVDPNSVSSRRRTTFMHQYLSSMLEAMNKGADVRGYFCWSFMDNFEWAFGYDKRFGMVYVDYETQERTPKPIAKWYGELAKTGKIPLIESVHPAN